MGGFVLILGLGALAFAIAFHLKGKRILAAPFKKTGELLKNPVSEDAKGAMSTEGRVLPPETPLYSPASKQQCLYYEIKVERLWEKTVTTEDGTKTERGKDTLDTIKGGSIFGLDDGSGRFEVDCTKGADFDNMKEGFKKEINGWSGSSNIQFGEFSYDVPVIGSNSGRTIGFKATEKYVPVGGDLFVLGKLEGSRLVKPGWRSMLASNKGREGLLGSVQKKKKFSFIGGGVAVAAAVPLMIFGPKADPNAAGASCPSQMTDVRLTCHDRVSSKSGNHVSWTVTKPGTYELEVFAPKKKVAFAPGLIVESADGVTLADISAGVGQNAKASLEVAAGTYDITVLPSDGYMVSGGFSYEFEIRDMSPAAPEGTPVADKELRLIEPLAADEAMPNGEDVAAAPAAVDSTAKLPALAPAKNTTKKK